MLLPLLFCGFAELVLRVFSLGGYPPIIRKTGLVNNGTLVITDPAGAGSWFFANPGRPGYNEQYCFLDPKPANAIRIFLVGESAIKGYPQPRNLASSAFLQTMLQDAAPERMVEVINLGTTAVASFPVLGITTEALDFQPDLVVVFAGHNEFFGTYGVASIGRAGSRPWMLRANRVIRSLALFQGLERLLPAKSAESNRTLMETMIGRSHIAPDDWRRAAAANNLGHNTAEMVRRCQARGVPVIVCTQPSNERDLAPVGADRLDHLPPATRQEIKSLLATGEVRRRDDPAVAIPALRRILELCPAHARAHFLLGQALAAQGGHADAREHFVQARDLDPMPWRTPSPSQQAIVRATREHHAPVCDLEKVFREVSPDGVIGWELMDDHVHPTLRGQALIAEAIINCLTNWPDRFGITPEARARIAPWDEYARRLGDNVYDRYGVAHQMRVLFDVPFMRQSNLEAFDRFNAVATGIENDMPPDVRQAMREWQTAKPHAGGKRPITGLVARVLMRQKNYTEALALFEIAQRSVPDYTSWHMEYVYFALACKEKLNGVLSDADRALALEEIRHGEFLLRRGFSETGFTERHLGRLHQLRGEFAEAIPFLVISRKKLSGLDLVAADEALVLSYLKTRQFNKARDLASYGAAHAGSYAAKYQEILSQLPALEKATGEGGISTNAIFDHGTIPTR